MGKYRCILYQCIKINSMWIIKKKKKESKKKKKKEKKKETSLRVL
jgi:hypothetical protein